MLGARCQSLNPADERWYLATSTQQPATSNDPQHYVASGGHGAFA